MRAKGRCSDVLRCTVRSEEIPPYDDQLPRVAPHPARTRIGFVAKHDPLNAGRRGQRETDGKGLQLPDSDFSYGQLLQSVCGVKRRKSVVAPAIERRSVSRTIRSCGGLCASSCLVVSSQCECARRLDLASPAPSLVLRVSGLSGAARILVVNRDHNGATPAVAGHITSRCAFARAATPPVEAPCACAAACPAQFGAAMPWHASAPRLHKRH